MQQLSKEELYQQVAPGLKFEETYFAQTLELLPRLNRQGPWLAGGAVRRVFTNEHQDTDFDFFFKTMEQYEEFCGLMRERGAETDYENPFNTTFLYEGRTIQAIKVDLCNTLIQTLRRFDFTICQFGFDGTNFVWGDQAWEHLQQKILVINNHENPIYTIQRAMKYANQGFHFPAPEIKKLMGKIEKQPELLENARPSPSDTVTKPATVTVNISDIKADNLAKTFATGGYVKGPQDLNPAILSTEYAISKSLAERIKRGI